MGARVELLGSEVGEVREVEIELDAATAAPRTRVLINLNPELFHLVHAGDAEHTAAAAAAATGPASAEDDMRRVLVRLVEGGGLRARVRIGNFLTNQRYVTLEREPGASAVKVDWTTRPVNLPTSGAIDHELGEDVEHLVSNLSRLPLGRLTTEATSTLTQMHRTLADFSALTTRVDKELVPRLQTAVTQSQKTLGAVERTLEDTDSPLQRDWHGSLRELTAAAQSIRVLAQSLNEHPESLVWGKKKGARK